MRLPYTSNPPTNLTPEEAPILERVLARRGERGLIPLDLTLLHAPQIADGWNSLLGAVRTKTSLSGDIREIVICRVALLNEAWFEWDAHLPILQKIQGWSREHTEVVGEKEPQHKGPLSKKQWMVLRYADEMTRNVKVGGDLFQEMRQRFGEKEIVEVTTTAATYNMVSRFLVALDVGEKNDKGPDLQSAHK
ncbi:MAG: hypothetical protein Q9227_008178 [Pyrenula ochraceoflavens]